MQSFFVGSFPIVNISNSEYMADFNLRRMRAIFISVMLLCALYQWSIFYDVPTNNLCTLLVVGASIATAFALFSASAFREAPVPALMILFFNISGLSGPLLFKTLEGDAITNNLLMSDFVFDVLVITQISLLMAMFVYRRFLFFRGVRNIIAEGLWRPLGLFNWPPDNIFWAMGIIGLVATFYFGVESDGASAGAATKILGGMQFFRYAPFLVIFRKLSKQVEAVSFYKYALCVAFLGCLVILGLVQNSRGLFVDAVMMCTCAVILCLANGSASLNRLRPSHLLIVVVFCVLIYVFMTKLALAMVSIRSFRGSVGYVELVGLTIEAFFDPRLSSAYQMTEVAVVNVGDYGETYVSSRLLSRLLMVKFHDNMLNYLSLMNEYSLNAIKDDTVDRLLGIMPQPLLDLLGIALDKTALNTSFGDYVIYLVDGWGLGGYKTGSMVANLYSLTGIFYPVVIFLIALVLFVVYDSFRREDGCFSPLFGLMMWGIVGTLGASGFNAESIANVISGLLRTVPQSVMLYFIVVLGGLGFLGVRERRL